MPRDLNLEKKTDVLDSMAPLTREPEGGAPPALESGGNKYHLAMLDEEEDEERVRKRNELGAFPEALTVGHLEQCVALEYAAFPPEEACTKEKFIYRLTTASELTLGLFTTATSPSPLLSLPTAAHAHTMPAVPPSPTTTSARDTATPADGVPRKSILLAHAVATKTTNPTVTDADMTLPPEWRTQSHINPELGHKEEGRTVALHSLAVLPEYQHIGLGRVLLGGFVQRMEGSGLVDRVALLSHEPLIPFYERCGFRCLGKSEATFGGGGWFDMVIDLTPNLPPGEMGGDIGGGGGRARRVGSLLGETELDDREELQERAARDEQAAAEAETKAATSTTTTVGDVHEEREKWQGKDDGKLAASLG